MNNPGAPQPQDWSFLAGVFNRNSPAQQAYDATQNGAHSGFNALMYRLIFGPGSQPGDGAPQATLQSFNPLHPAGALNDLSMFFGGPKGDATPMMESLGMHGQFTHYGDQTGSALDRGVVHEGPNPGARGAGIHGLIRRAQGVSPFNRPDPVKAAEARHALVEKQVASAFERQQAIRAMAARKQVDAKLGSVPMAGLAEHPTPEHDYFNSHEFDHHVDTAHGDPRVALVHALMQRRYQAQLGHNHLN